ncbi:hypothetical protein PQR67_13470 [Paraburkholderia fungorum]|uniref:hypothetical protein n=1 Tax=Paraburkholderia fungorum TaxID=134537 RepID=UPI0038B89807
MTSSARGNSAGHGNPRLYQFQIWPIVATFTAAPRRTYAIGISVDDETAIAISTAANGHQAVTIALAVAGKLNNTDRRFNVEAARASLHHAGIHARAISTQLTCTDPGAISEPAGGIGSRANPIWANPNCAESGALTRST